MQDNLKVLSPAERDRLARLDDIKQLRAESETNSFIDQIAFTPLTGASPCVPDTLRIGAWNMQQCHYPEDSAKLLAGANLDIALLTEMDIGMARTGQLNGVTAMADAQGHCAVYAPEFLELQHGSANAVGFHCNAITARFAPVDACLIRLPEEADWLIAPRRGQRRFGGRMALAARFTLADGFLTVCVTHLESDTDGEGRARQMTFLLDELEIFAKGSPVLIGGDFNAGARTADFDALSDPFFDHARKKGYQWGDYNTGKPTSRVSRNINAVQQDKARYDWFLGRDLHPSDAENIDAIDEAGRAISDHDAIAITISAK